MNASRFFVAPFTNDGKLIGVGPWELSELSPKWLDVCEAILSHQGPGFRISLEEALSHLEIKLTSANGAGLGMFFAHGHLAISTCYLCGDDLDAENEILSMFVSSLRRSQTMQTSHVSDLPFEEVFSLKQRPLHIVVLWANPKISADDQELIHELSIHFAGAFLCRPAS